MSDSDVFRLTLHKQDFLRKLDGWRRNVAGLASLTPAAASGESQTAGSTLVVLSWNVWIGRGRLLELVRRLRRGEFAPQGADPDMPLVVLVQEAYRHVPGMAAGLARHAGGLRPARLTQPREDIVETANALGMHLRYAPSMRNGATQSDRGNAILSTLPLEDAEAIELPHLLQRRVAVSARVQVGGVPLTVVSAHLDPRGPISHRVLGVHGRSLQTEHLVQALVQDAIIIGADLNIVGGRRERTWRLLHEAGFCMGVPEMIPSWRHTYHGIPHLQLDYVLMRDRHGAIQHATVHRLDERPQDRGRFVFGSDHHPMLSRIDLVLATASPPSSQDHTS